MRQFHLKCGKCCNLYTMFCNSFGVGFHHQWTKWNHNVPKLSKYQEEIIHIVVVIYKRFRVELSLLHFIQYVTDSGILCQEKSSQSLCFRWIKMQEKLKQIDSDQKRITWWFKRIQMHISHIGQNICIRSNAQKCHHSFWSVFRNKVACVASIDED